MGYTHYWYRPKAIPVATWEKFRADVCLLTNTWNKAETPERRVAYEYDQPGKLPTANKNQVRFNGIGEGGHETLIIERVIPKADWDRPSFRGGPKTEEFTFCKTAEKPYDGLVVACLIALHHHVPETNVSSDGDDGDWAKGRTFCQDILGYGSEYEFQKNTDDRRLIHKPVQPTAAT